MICSEILPPSGRPCSLSAALFRFAVPQATEGFMIQNAQRSPRRYDVFGGFFLFDFDSSWGGFPHFKEKTDFFAGILDMRFNLRTDAGNIAV